MDNDITKNEEGVTIYILSSLYQPPRVLHVKATEEQLVLYIQSMALAGNDAGVALLSQSDIEEDISSHTHKYLLVWDKCGFKKITVNHIVYLEASRSYTYIHLNDGKSILVSVPMSETYKYLPKDDFIRIHRTYVVNLRYVEALIGNTLTMENGSQIPIGREFRSEVYKSFTFVGTKNRKYTG